jgi:transcriptional regulatory protein RtcR
MKEKRRVVFGFVGPTHDDKGKGAKRWKEWRPSIELCRRYQPAIDRFELLHQPKHKALAELIASDVPAVSPQTNVKLTQIELPDPWKFDVVYAALFDFAKAYKFNNDAEEYLVHITLGTHVMQICLFLLTEARFLPARLVQTPRPDEGQEKPPQVIDLNLSIYDLIAKRFVREFRDDVSYLKDGIATRNKEYDTQIKKIGHVALRSSYPILLTGPTGAGKSALALRIHNLKNNKGRVSSAFIHVNCATLRGDTAMSALFGHKKGAFTGAIAEYDGYLKRADKGTLFLDEIGELEAEAQAMLLHAVEEKKFWPVGGKKVESSDFHLIAGTNCDLAEQVREGRFRKDLFARIKIWSFKLPALKDRREDIEPNLDRELEKFVESTHTHVTINAEARDKFLDFALSPRAEWPGNFRDLNAAVIRMATMAKGGRITVDEAAEEIERLGEEWAQTDRSDCHPLVELVLGTVRAAEFDHFDKVQLEQVLKVCRDSATRSDAGRRLYDVSRKRKKVPNDADRLNKYLDTFGLDWHQVKQALLRPAE